MKFLLTSALILASIVIGLSQKSILSIPASQSVEIDYPGYDVFKASLQNQSLKGVAIAVISKESGNQVRGFGLGPKAKADVMVEAESLLRLTNETAGDLSVKVEIEEATREVFEMKDPSRSFSLLNTSDKSIPLLIPSVMNPNLSPNSRSGVDLKIGQEILFKVKGKKYILLTVDESINDGDELDVATLLKERKEALGL